MRSKPDLKQARKEPRNAQASPPEAHDHVLARPRISISGVRQIPKLVHANGIPILRYKKPQPHMLSVMIKSKIQQRQIRHDRKVLLGRMIDMGQNEDEWDDIIETETGRAVAPLLGSWMASSKHELFKLNDRLFAEKREKTSRTEKYMDIIDEEIALKKQEASAKATTKRARQRRRARARRLEPESGGLEGEADLGRPPRI